MRSIILLACIFFGGIFPVLGQTELQQRLDTAIDELLPPGSDIGVSVYNLTTKEPLYSYKADKLCRPASTMKLLTTITALDIPGGIEPFQTNAWYKGTIKQDTLHGNLYVIGGFDPLFGDTEMDKLVGRIANLPFSVITGKVYGDISMKDSLYWGHGWAWDDTPAAFQPYLSPLMFNKGKVIVVANRTAKGEQATVTVEPESTFYRVINETKSRTPAAGGFIVTRNWLEHGNDIIVKGNVDRNRGGEVNIYRPQDFFMHTFTERLRKHIVVDNVYGYEEFIPDSTAVFITRLETPIEDVLTQVMKESDNLCAEALLYRLGAQCEGRKRISANDGLNAISRLMQKLGHTPKNYKLADGCGLSDYNYLSPALLVDFLTFAHSHAVLFPYLYKALPTAGVDGTLQNRMKGKSPALNRVFAKTGSITGINTLAGYARNSKGNDMAFAIMNQNVLTQADARKLQEKICEILCE